MMGILTMLPMANSLRYSVPRMTIPDTFGVATLNRTRHEVRTPECQGPCVSCTR